VRQVVRFGRRPGHQIPAGRGETVRRATRPAPHEEEEQVRAHAAGWSNSAPVFLSTFAVIASVPIVFTPVKFENVRFCHHSIHNTTSSNWPEVLSGESTMSPMLYVWP